MASTKLKCFICQNIYTDPVRLKCGHNFCRDCIDRVLDTQKGSGGYSCPECREKFQDRPALHRNRALRNTLENFLSAQRDQESGVFCSYCLESPVPAVRSCLHCQDSLCEKHMRAHKKSPEHILIDPTLSMESRKCSVHKKILEYYCTEDETCICASCCLIGGHKGHEMESLGEASEKKKETLRNVLQKLLTKREETEERVQSLQEHRRKVEEAAGDTERVTVLFRDLRRRLEYLEKRVLREISGRAERISISIRDLEIKKEELSRKLRHIEELCNMTDPLTVLQESDTGDLCDTEDGDNEDRERHEELLHDGGGLDVDGISHTLHTLSNIITEVNVYFCIEEAADILLDVNTAQNKIHISDDRKTVSKSDLNQNHSETPGRFQDYSQVLSSQSFSSGRHYWDVDVGRSDRWSVGMCYPSIDRRGGQSGIGNNTKSWGLYRDGGQCRMVHNSNKIPLSTNLSSNRVRIYLDYEAGQISFYDLCDPIRHFLTFTTTFTEPLHAGLGVWRGWIKICGGNQVIKEICPENGGTTGKMPSAKKPKQGQTVAVDPTKEAVGTQQKVTKEPKQRAAASLARVLTWIVSNDGRRSSVGTEHTISVPVDESPRVHHTSFLGVGRVSPILSEGGMAKTVSGQRVSNWIGNSVGATELEKGFSVPLGGEPVGKNYSSNCLVSGGKPEQEPAAIPAAASAKTVPDPKSKDFWEKKAPRTQFCHPTAQRNNVPEEPMVEESGTEGPSSQETKGSIEGKEPSSTQEESNEETASPVRKRLKMESATLQRRDTGYNSKKRGVPGQAEVTYASASDSVNTGEFGFSPGNLDL
ncbi:E3 ubiquitin-protein ligase TRIM21-like [Lithobates pipiens]